MSSDNMLSDNTLSSSNTSTIKFGQYKVETNNNVTKVWYRTKLLVRLNPNENYVLPDGSRVKALRGGHSLERANGTIQKQINIAT